MNQSVILARSLPADESHIHSGSLHQYASRLYKKNGMIEQDVVSARQLVRRVEQVEVRVRWYNRSTRGHSPRPTLSSAILCLALSWNRAQQTL